MLVFAAQMSHAQYVAPPDRPYHTSIGIRVGGTSGVTLKHYYRPTMAIEGIIGTFGNGFSITGLIQKSANAFDLEGLNWYYGGGAHVAFYNGNRYYRLYGREVVYRENHDVGIGINGIIGLEYRLPDNVPVAFSLDLKPFIEVDSDGDVGVAPDMALGIKFILQ